MVISFTSCYMTQPSDTYQPVANKAEIAPERLFYAENKAVPQNWTLHRPEMVVQKCKTNWSVCARQQASSQYREYALIMS